MQELVAANQLISKIINCERKTSRLKVSLSIYMYKLLQKCFIIGGKRGKNACPQVSDDGRIIVTINQLCLNGSCIIISIYLYSQVNDWSKNSIHYLWNYREPTATVSWGLEIKTIISYHRKLSSLKPWMAPYWTSQWPIGSNQ